MLAACAHLLTCEIRNNYAGSLLLIYVFQDLICMLHSCFLYVDDGQTLSPRYHLKEKLVILEPGCRSLIQPCSPQRYKDEMKLFSEDAIDAQSTGSLDCVKGGSRAEVMGTCRMIYQTAPS